MRIGDLIWLGQRLADAGRVDNSVYAPQVPTAELILMGDLLIHSPSTITSLAERTGYAQSRVSTAVAGMVKRGWAQTRSDPADGRRTLVFVPEQVGRKAHEFQGRSGARTLGRLLAGLPVSRRSTIIPAIRVSDLISEIAAGGAEHVAEWDTRDGRSSSPPIHASGSVAPLSVIEPARSIISVTVGRGGSSQLAKLARRRSSP